MSGIQFRHATFADAALLFAWRNDPITRQNSHHSAPLDFESHCSWLEQTLQRDDVTIFIAELEHYPIGTIKIQHEATGTALLSWTVAPTYRGRGFAALMVQHVAEIILPYATLRAEIKHENRASIKAASMAGFVFTHATENILHCQRKPIE
jgi:RimJ/RimL family protein N-acetyltransferase